MHAFFHTRSAQSQHRARPPRPRACMSACLIQLTVDTNAFTALRGAA
ncbi:hypothetical protein DUGA2_54090 [Duganella sp. HH101]|nr:hypothetical protein DUGA2_54090 [Duganella sp. HH101]